MRALVKQTEVHHQSLDLKPKLLRITLPQANDLWHIASQIHDGGGLAGARPRINHTGNQLFVARANFIGIMERLGLA